MRKTLLTTLTMFLCLGLQAQDIVSEKTALLLVHFGTTHDDTRAKTLDAITRRVKESYPDYEVRESYSSRIVARRLQQRGIHKSSPQEAMFRLLGEGYTRLVVQPTYLIDGVEMNQLRREVEQLRPFFSDVRVGVPLLYSVDDTRCVVDILTRRHPADTKRRSHVMFVGHGTPTPATAQYCQLDYMLKSDGHPCHHVGTIEGYPTQSDALRQVSAARGKSVTLVPLLVVAGDHAANDISREWKEQLEQAGLNVTLRIEGLGEVPEIQDLYIQHIQQLLSTP